MKNIEHQEQVTLINWSNLQHLPNSAEKIGDYLVAIPNGGARNKITGAILKAEGVKAGFPDLFFCFPSEKYHGLFIEMKARTKTARVSDVQKVWQKRLNAQNYKSVVCYGFVEAKTTIEKYLRNEE